MRDALLGVNLDEVRDGAGRVRTILESTVIVVSGVSHDGLTDSGQAERDALAPHKVHACMPAARRARFWPEPVSVSEGPNASHPLEILARANHLSSNTAVGQIRLDSPDNRNCTAASQDSGNVQSSSWPCSRSGSSAVSQPHLIGACQNIGTRHTLIAAVLNIMHIAWIDSALCRLSFGPGQNLALVEFKRCETVILASPTGACQNID
jgi:hypothetical protein